MNVEKCMGNMARRWRTKTDMEGSCWNHRDTEFLGEDSCCYFRAQREPSILSPQIVTQREQCVQRSHLMVQGGRPASTNVTLHHQSTLGRVTTKAKTFTMLLVRKDAGCWSLRSPRFPMLGSCVTIQTGWESWRESLLMESCSGFLWILSEATMNVSCVNFQTKEQ